MKWLVWLATLLNPETETTDMTFTEITDRSELPLLNPDLNERKTAKIHLSNGLEALLISDPKADQSSAAVSVGSGSWDDPEEYPGMAHFCEHMLFLGTKKYPDSNEFMAKVSDFGGMTNAFTQPHQTVYMFSCKHDGFLENLDRFSRFFIDPIFDEKHIARELHAVDQEYAKNLENDRWREYMVFKELSNPDHPNRKFSSGNSETLSGIPQQSLKDWHENHYGAEKIKVFIYSNEPIDDLKQKTAELFFEVKATSSEPTLRPKSSILSSKTKGNITYIQPITSQQMLSLCWELPHELSDDASHSAELVAYALNRGQEKSLYEKLKREELINMAQFNVEEVGGKENRFFYMTLDLTEKGVRELQKTILHCFEAIAGLKERGVPSYLFEEKNAITKLSYQYQSRGDAFRMAQSVGESLSNEDLSTYPKAQILADTYSKEKINQTLQLLVPETCYISLSAPSTLTGVEPDTKERWFQAEYAIRPIDPTWISAWENAAVNPDIALAEANPYLPTKFDLVEVEGSTPTLFSDVDSGVAYYCRCSEFSTPEAVIHLHIRSPKIKSDAKSIVLTSLYLDHLTDLLHPTLSAASAAGLRTNFDLSKLKLHILVAGFNDKAPLLLQEILRQMPQNPPTKEQFDIYVSRHEKDFLNAEKALPLFQAKDYLDSLLMNNHATSHEKLAALQAITYEEFLTFHSELLQKTYAEALFSGNLTLQEAQSSWIDIQHSLSQNIYPKAEHDQPKVLELSNTGPFAINQTTDALGNGAILTLDAGAFTHANKAASEILGSSLREPFFNELRTKQKTGYIAKAEPIELEARLFQLFLVQSNSHHPDDLLYRFELFLEEYLQTIDEQVPLDRFNLLKASAIHSLKTRFRNLRDKSALWDLLAFEKQADFSYVEKRIEALQALTYDTFKAFSAETISRLNKKRLAVLFKGKLHAPFSYREVAPSELKSLSRYVAKEDVITSTED